MYLQKTKNGFKMWTRKPERTKRTPEKKIVHNGETIIPFRKGEKNPNK